MNWSGGDLLLRYYPPRSATMLMRRRAMMLARARMVFAIVGPFRCSDLKLPFHQILEARIEI